MLKAERDTLGERRDAVDVMRRYALRTDALRMRIA